MRAITHHSDRYSTAWTTAPVAGTRRPLNSGDNASRPHGPCWTCATPMPGGLKRPEAPAGKQAARACRPSPAGCCPSCVSADTAPDDGAPGTVRWCAARRRPGPGGHRYHRLIRSRSVAPGSSRAGPPRRASSSARNGVSATSWPDAKPPWATSSVTQAGVPDTGVREPTVSVPSVMPVLILLAPLNAVLPTPGDRSAGR
jgi:hypothetical protein